MSLSSSTSCSTANGSNVKLVVTVPVKKNVCDAYVLALPLGFLGLHHFYLRRYGFGVLYLVTFGLLGVGWVVDWFGVPHLVSMTNKKIANPQLPSKKDLTDAYVLWFPLGFLGLHHFYLRRPLWGVAYLCTFGLLGVGWLIDGCRMKHLVDTCNEKLLVQHAKGPQTKNLTDAYVLTLMPITGLLGFQHYYLGRMAMGFLYTFTLGLLGIGWLVDVFRMSCLVKYVNRKILEGDDGKKRLDDAYVLCFPLGFLGLHHFYLRRYVWGSLYLCTFGLLGLGWIIDWFRLPCLVSDYNKRAGQTLMVTHAIIQQQHYGQGPNSQQVITHGVQPGTYPPPGSYPAGQQPPGYQYPAQQLPGYQYPAQAPAGYQQQQPVAGLYPQVPPYPGYPAVVTADSSWSTIASSEVGQREMGMAAGEEHPSPPPSYQDSTANEDNKNNESNATPNAPPLPTKKDAP